MKKFVLALSCLVFANLQAMECETQFENEQMSVAKVTIQPYEEIEPHRDEHPQVVIALKGGTITRLEVDGQETEIHFPTGAAVMCEADPEDELHASVNNSPEPVELIVIQLKDTPPTPKLECKSESANEISINIKIHCQTSDEWQDFVNSIPSEGSDASNFGEWKSSFLNNMSQLIRLVESDNLFDASLSVQTNSSEKE